MPIKHQQDRDERVPSQGKQSYNELLTEEKRRIVLLCVPLFTVHIAIPAFDF